MRLRPTIKVYVRRALCRPLILLKQGGRNAPGASNNVSETVVNHNLRRVGQRTIGGRTIGLRFV